MSPGAIPMAMAVARTQAASDVEALLEFWGS